MSPRKPTWRRRELVGMVAEGPAAMGHFQPLSITPGQGLVTAAISDGGCNTFVKLLCRRTITQRLSGSLVKLTRHFVQVCL